MASLEDSPIEPGIGGQRPHSHPRGNQPEGTSGADQRGTSGVAEDQHRHQRYARQGGIGPVDLEASMSLLNCPGGFLVDYEPATQSIHVSQALGMAARLRGLTLAVKETRQVIESQESHILPWEEIREKITHPVLRQMLIPCRS